MGMLADFPQSDWDKRAVLTQDYRYDLLLELIY